MNYLKVLVLCCILFASCEDKVINEPARPIAIAGEDQSIISGSYVVFDPSKSIGFINWYEWQQDENNPEKVKLFSSSYNYLQQVGFVKEGIYRFKLIVRDGVTPGDYIGTSASIPDELVITVNPNPYKKFEDMNLEITVRVALKKQVEELTESILLTLDSL